MPRTLSVASRLYEPGVYGPFSVDKFTNVNTDALRSTFTVENWPHEIDPLFRVTMKWDNGDSATAHVSGRQLEKDGSQKASISFTFNVRKIPNNGSNNGKAKVEGGEIELEAFHPFRTAITFGAI